MPVTSSSDRVRCPACPDRHSVNIEEKKKTRESLINYIMVTQAECKKKLQHNDIGWFFKDKWFAYYFWPCCTEVQWIGWGPLSVRSSFVDLVQDLVFHLGDGVDVQNLHGTWLDFYSALNQHCQCLRKHHGSVNQSQLGLAPASSRLWQICNMDEIN